MKTLLRVSMAAIFAAVPLQAAMIIGQTPVRSPEPPSTLGIDQGISDFETADFKIKLVKASQTLAALEPKGATGFDFTPADRMAKRAADGFYHFGDITFRLRAEDGTWREF